jgi:hypothetical protein
MINLTIHKNNDIDSDRHKAIATARMVKYAAKDAEDIGLKECSQLLLFVTDLIKIKFNVQNNEVDFDLDNSKYIRPCKN